MSLTLDTTEMEARLEQRIAERVERIMARHLNGADNGKHDATGDRWMSLTEVAKRVGRAKRTVNDHAEDGKFPKHAVVWNGVKMWRESVIDRWMKDREKAGSV